MGVLCRQQQWKVLSQCYFEGFPFYLTMCRPVTSLGSELRLEQSLDQNCLRKARRVVKKYKKISLKKEMNRLRQLLPKGETLKQHEVLDQTILMIQELEMKLLTRIKQAGAPPKIATVMDRSCGQRTENLDLDKLRNLVMMTMMNNR